MFPRAFGKYILERELSAGGMAVVYLATLRGAGGFEKRLVVKQIRAELASDDAFVERFVTEAKTTVELSHANIVPVYELGVEQGVYFIAMELALGLTLAELLAETGPLSPEEGAYLGVEMCRALDYAHRRASVVHRDVTPRNVIIDEEGAVRLIDFGIAAPVSPEKGPRERVFGSPGHMPVEQLRGGRLTPATDVFAVGALLIEAWTGSAPFRRATRLESDAALAELPAALSEKTPALAALDPLIARAVSFNAGDRPQSAEDLARPLRDFLKTADLGDLARRLGERVRAARKESPLPSKPSHAHAELRPRTPVTAALGAPLTEASSATRPFASIGTETFAASSEVSRWTGRIATLPPPPEGQGAREMEPDRVAPPQKSFRSGTLALVIGLGALTAFFATTRSMETSPPPPVSKVISPAPLASMPASTPTLVVPVVPALATATPPPPSSSTLTRTRLSSAEDVEAETKPAPLAFFTFTSDLPARVTMDGASQGVTPLRGLKRGAGRHVVSLVSVELGEHLTTTVNAKPGGAVGVHAEFTRAVPALKIR